MADVVPLHRRRVVILGGAPYWAVVPGLGERSDPRIWRIGLICPTLEEARAAATRMARYLGVDEIEMRPIGSKPSGGGRAA